MSQVSIRYYNMLAAYAGKRDEVVALPPGATLRSLLDDLLVNNAKRFRQVMQDGRGEKMFSPYVRIFVNDQLVADDAFEMTLADGDRVYLFLTVSGG